MTRKIRAAALLEALFACAIVLCALVPALPLSSDNGLRAYAAEASAPDSASEASDAATGDADSRSLEALARAKGDGTYYGTGEGYQSDITVAVTVEGGRVAKVKVVSHADDQTYLEHAKKLLTTMVDQQSFDVDVASGATFSSRGIIAATRDALSGSGKASVASGPWFSIAMIAVAALLFAAAVVFAVRWRRARTAKERRAATRLQQLALQAMFFILAPSAFASAFMGIKSLISQFYLMQTHRGFDFSVGLFTVLLAALVAFTVVFGRFFCGFACSFGFLGDVVYGAGDIVCRKLGIHRRPLPKALERILSMIKYAVLIAVCAAIWLGFAQFVNSNSPWTAFSGLANLSVKRITAISAVLLAVIVVGMAWKERFFCEFLCPLGAIFSIIPVLPTGRMKRMRPKCVKGCAACERACPVDREPKQKALAGECVACGRCADSCPVGNVTCGIELRVDAGAEKRGGLRDVATSRVVSVLWKAVLLLALLWLMEATRFLPTPFD